MHTPQFVLYGHFGVGNIGNDSTLEAALYNIRHYQPKAKITCVCSGPQVVAQRFGIPTLPIDIAEDRNLRQMTGRAPGKVRRLTRRAIDELDFWLNRTRWLRTVDQFIVVGTGALDDMATRPWNMPYDLFKWCRAAQLAGARVVFLSVGAGPIVHPLSRLLMLNALRTATYRSYRDDASLAYLQKVGVNTAKDVVYPDLVFSLPPATSAPVTTTPIQTVGVGVIGYYGWRHDHQLGEPVYQAYMRKLKQFVHWLLAQGYGVRILMGDYPTDLRPADDLLASVRTAGADDWQKRIYLEPMADVADLLRQIAQTEIVVASRFHNVLSALLLARPVISLGYHVKNDALMAEMGLAAYCQPIEHFTVDQLIQQFGALVAERSQAVQRIQTQQVRNRELLAEQYQRVLGANDRLKT